MKNITEHTGILTIIKRLKRSVNGNPRYLVEIDGWTVRTSPDSSLAYELPNYDGKEVIATVGTYYGYATLGSVKESSLSRVKP